MLIAQQKIANVRIYDMSKYINIRSIQPTFHKINFPYKNLLKVSYTEDRKIKYQEQKHNYPEFKMNIDDGCESMVYRSVLFFCEQQNIEKDSIIWIEATHISPYSYMEKEWFRENNKKKAILCIQKESIDYAKYELKEKNQTNIFRWDFNPGEMMLFDSEDTLQRYHIEFKDASGYQNLLSIIV